MPPSPYPRIELRYTWHVVVVPDTRVPESSQENLLNIPTLRISLMLQQSSLGAVDGGINTNTEIQNM